MNKIPIHFFFFNMSKNRKKRFSNLFKLKRCIMSDDEKNVSPENVLYCFLSFYENYSYSDSYACNWSSNSNNDD